jgi:hypothetical protein
MVWWKWLVVVGAMLGSAVGGYVIFTWSSARYLTESVEVDWRKLGELDYITGIASEDLKKLDGQIVRVPGFMVPLEDEVKSVTEFLLVPNPQACIHVPPPPSNQMVFVTVAKSAHQNVQFGPIWVYGKLKLSPKNHQYGEASFQLESLAIERYR